jgi:mannose-6-phosphate isomerase-like protein (cupin superfamily)
MHIIRWQDSTPPQEHHLRLHMQQEGLSPYTWSNSPNYSYAVHTHSYQKVLFCVNGSIRFILHSQSTASGEESSIDLLPGDCMILPAGIPHSAQVGPEGVTCLEAACSSNAQLADQFGEHIRKRLGVRDQRPSKKAGT